MLRIQLPILLSFAILRCLIGAGIKFWVCKVVPEPVQRRFTPLNDATKTVLSFLHVALLCTAQYFLVGTHLMWSNKAGGMGASGISLVCAEYALPRVQGLICAIGMLALFTNSDPLALSLALTTLKGVADGTVFAIVLACLTWRASCMSHKTVPILFFAVLLTSTGAYTALCYEDEAKHDRTQGAVLAASFASLFLLCKMISALLQRVVRTCHAWWQWTKRAVRRRTLTHAD